MMKGVLWLREVWVLFLWSCKSVWTLSFEDDAGWVVFWGFGLRRGCFLEGRERVRGSRGETQHYSWFGLVVVDRKPLGGRRQTRGST